MPDVATVFTTHATSIGRSICCNNKPLYDYLHAYDGDQMAGELNMQSKHSLEKAAALNADAFTTVSEVTAKECSQLLGRTPIVTPNGFEQNYVPEGEKFIAKRKRARRKMLQITNSLLGTEYNDDTIFIATSGRNEFRNKGIDAFIDTINILRAQWKEKLPPVVAFIMVPSWIDSPREDLRNELLLPAFLQDIGKFIISQLIQDDRQTEFFLKSLVETDDISACELEFTGYTCSRISANIFKHWDFSHNIIFPIAFTQDLEKFKLDLKDLNLKEKP
jgi:hypothetical protein